MDAYLVNFVMRKGKKGYGLFHKKLITTEYSIWLKNLDSVNSEKFILKANVITVLISPTDLTYSGIRYLFMGLREFCEKNRIKRILVPVVPLVVKGADSEVIKMAIEKELVSKGLNVSAG
jgi:hypothetical protein